MPLDAFERGPKLPREQCCVDLREAWTHTLAFAARLGRHTGPCHVEFSLDQRRAEANEAAVALQVFVLPLLDGLLTLHLVHGCCALHILRATRRVCVDGAT